MTGGTHGAPAHRTYRAAPRPAYSGGSGRAGMDAAIARIPNYRQGVVGLWSYTSRYGSYGTANLVTREITVSPRVPANLMFSVVVHEYAHELALHNYGGDWQTSGAAMSQAFGAPVVRAQELAADCMARLQGATWTYYTSCSNASWRASAATLLAGNRL